MRKLTLALILLFAPLAFAQSVGGIFFETSYTRSQGTAATPTFNPVAGTYSGTQSVTISSSTAGATLCYTTDGSDPAAATPGTCSAGSTYSTPVSVASSLTLKALATKASYSNSAVGSAGYTISAPGGNVTDDFNRADGALGANWTDWTGNNKLVISGNKVHGTAVWASTPIAFYTGANFGNNQWAQITISNLTGTSVDGVRLILRATQNSTAFSGYIAFCSLAVANNCKIWKVTNATTLDNGSPSVLAQATVTVANGDVIRFEITGNALTIKQNGTTIVGPYTDSTSPYTTGRVGIGVNQGNGTDTYGDNFSAGPTI